MAEELEGSSNADHDMETPDEGQNQENIRCVHLFNCDKTYKLDAVKKLFQSFEEYPLKTKLNFAFSVKCHDFALRDMSQVCETIIRDQIKVDDVAVFVVHAHESRLSINEDNAGIGYAKIYRALLRATDGKVLIVIGGDDSYKDSAEEKNSFLSRWARRKISSQFSEEYLDGRKSFIFSWNKKHRPIHEEALLHYFDHFDPDKEEKKFVLVEKKEEETVSEGQKQQVEIQERTESDVEHRRTEGQSPETELQRGQKRREQIAPLQLPQTEEGASEDMEIVSRLSVDDEKHKNMEDVENSFHFVSKADCSEDSMQKTEPKRARVEQMESIAILIRDESDINTMKDVFGDVLPGINPITSRDPRDMKVLLENTPVRSCFIIVESTKIKEESLTKSSSTVYQDLLKTANRIVEKKIVVILCSEGQSLTPSEEGSITATIKELLGEKGLVFLCKGNNKTKRSSLSRSHSLPAGNRVPSTHVERPLNPEEFTLVFKTRLRLGNISYDEKDVKVKQEGWTAPQKMVKNLFREWHTISNVELSVYRENKTGDERTVVTEDWESRVSGLGESVKGALERVPLPNCVRERVVEGTNTIGAGDTRFTEVGADANSGNDSGWMSVGANVLGAIAQVGSNLIRGSGPGMEATGPFVTAELPADGSGNIPSADSGPGMEATWPFVTAELPADGSGNIPSADSDKDTPPD